MKLYSFPAKVLKIGPQAEEALNGIAANRLNESHNAFLDKQGRIIATVSQFQVSKDEIYLVVMQGAFEALSQHLKKMLMFASAQVGVTDLQIYFDLDRKYQPKSGEFTIPEKAGQLVITEKVPATFFRSAEKGSGYLFCTEAEFTQFRLDHGIALHGVDYQNEMLLNLNDESYVSHDKGCYLGQEIIARVHYKSRPPRKLTVMDEAKVPAELRSQMTSVTDGRGFILLSNKE